MTKKVLGYISLAAGILACVVAIFYLANTIMTAVDFDWTANNSVKTYIYEGVLILALACATVGFTYGGVKIVQAFLGKKEIGNKLLTFPMAVYFAAEFVFAGIAIGFWGLDNVSSWIFGLLAALGLVLTLCPTFAKLDEKNTNLVLLIASILGFVLTIVGLTRTGGVAAAELVFTMFMFACVAAIYITYVVTAASNNSKAEEVNEEPAKEEVAEESKDSEKEAE